MAQTHEPEGDDLPDDPIGAVACGSDWIPSILGEVASLGRALGSCAIWHRSGSLANLVDAFASTDDALRKLEDEIRLYRRWVRAARLRADEYTAIDFRRRGRP